MIETVPMITMGSDPPSTTRLMSPPWYLQIIYCPRYVCCLILEGHLVAESCQIVGCASWFEECPCYSTIARPKYWSWLWPCLSNSQCWTDALLSHTAWLACYKLQVLKKTFGIEDSLSSSDQCIPTGMVFQQNWSPRWEGHIYSVVYTVHQGLVWMPFSSEWSICK